MSEWIMLQRTCNIGFPQCMSTMCTHGHYVGIDSFTSTCEFSLLGESLPSVLMDNACVMDSVTRTCNIGFPQ